MFRQTIACLVCILLIGRCDRVQAQGSGTIAFVSNAGERGITTIHTDGSHRKRLTEGSDHAPSWAPDGQLIAFHSDRDLDRDFEVWTVAVGSLEERRVSPTGSSCSEPSWTPDGSRIVVRCTDGFYVVDADATNWQPLDLFDTRNVRSPVWFVGLDQLAFFCAEAMAACMAPAGESSNPSLVAYLGGTPRGPIWEPSWSRDGRRVSFGAGPGFDIYTMDLASGEAKQLTIDVSPEGESRLTANDTDPAWSADGSQLAFVSDRSGTRQIFVMNADGSGVRQVTDGTTEALNPAPWWPTGIGSTAIVSSAWGQLKARARSEIFGQVDVRRRDNDGARRKD